MLKDKIVGLLTEAGQTVLNNFHDGEFQTEEYSWDDEDTTDFRNLLVENKITFENVDRYGGEDQGYDYWSVYSFSDGAEVVFIKFDGWYASYDGSTYERFYEVQAVEKTITVFEKK
jgi:hypothetical protein